MGTNGNRLISLVAKEYEYKGQKIAGYLWRDPASITGYLRERTGLETDIGKVYEILSSKRLELNNKVTPIIYARTGRCAPR